MPVFLAPVLAAVGVGSAIPLAGIGSISIGSILGYGISLGTAVGSTLLLRALERRHHQQNQVTLKQSIPPRVRGYGRVKIGGATFYMAATEVFVQGVIFCEGDQYGIDGFEEIWLNDLLITGVQPNYGAMSIDFAFGGWSWGENVAVYLQDGTATQTQNLAFTNAAWEHAAWWDWTHRNQGLANGVICCSLPPDAEKNFSKTYPNGIPAMRVVARLSKIYDPRDGGTRWSDNPALCIRDYLTNSRGFGISPSLIDDTSFIAMANICDQWVEMINGSAIIDRGYYDSTVNHNMEPRYRFWGTYTMDEEPRAVLRRLLASCDGEIYQLASGKIAIRGGVWTDPTVTISDDMILSYELHQGYDKLAAFNELRIRYRDVNYGGDYQIIEGWPYQDLASQTALGQVLPQDFDGTNFPTFSQAYRLAKIAMHKGNPQWVLTLHCNFAALNALGERIVTVQLNEVGINTTFFVQKFEISLSDYTCMITLGALDSSAYAWNPDAEATLPPPSSGFGGGLVIPAVSGFILLTQNIIVAGLVTSVLAVASITPPSQLMYSLAAQISVDDGATWADMGVSGWSATSGPLSATITYQVRVALKLSNGNVGPWTTGTISTVGASVGTVLAALSIGNVDLGTADTAATSTDDMALASDPAYVRVDLGVLP